MLRPQCDIFEHDPVLISTQSNMFSLSPDARSIETRSDGDSNNDNDTYPLRPKATGIRAHSFSPSVTAGFWFPERSQIQCNYR